MYLFEQVLPDNYHIFRLYIDIATVSYKSFGRCQATEVILPIESSLVCLARIGVRDFFVLGAVTPFNPGTKCVGSPRIMNDLTPDFPPVSWAWMHG